MTRHKRSKQVTLGDRLRNAREKLGKSQWDVATEAGLRPETLSRLENGSSAGLSSLHKLAPVLGLDVMRLVSSREKEKGK